MKCKGCYKEGEEGYCLDCRKQLFDKARIPAVLGFDAPKSANFTSFQEHTKRLSISGAQLKYSLHLTGKTLELTEHAGQYILKPVPPNSHLKALEDVPENEHLTMQIASKLFRIRTAANALIYFKDGTPAYITRRFDVKKDGSKYQQEDFAQLTNRTREGNGDNYKYDGSYEEIGLLINKYVAAGVPASEQFYKLVLFNYVVSNGDAHLKNFSVMRSEGGEYMLTPAYDVMSTIIHLPNETDTALDLYKDDMQSPYYSSYGHYGRENFLELGKRLGIKANRANRMIDDFGVKSNAMLHMVAGSFLSDAAKIAYIKNIGDRISRLIGGIHADITW